MINESILNSCKYIYSIFNIPMFFYEDNNVVTSFSYNRLDYNFLKSYEEKLLSYTHPVYYIVSESTLYYGKIHITGTNVTILLGPITTTLPSNKNLNSFIKTLSNTDYTIKDLQYYFNSKHLLSFDKFLQILCLINYILNNEVITSNYILNYNENDYSDSISKTYTESSYKSKENNIIHNTYEFEQLYLYYVEKGRIDKLNSLLSESYSLTAGIIAYDNIRQAKNIFITSVTLTTRAAIRGGLDVETAYQLSDTYIQQMEYLDDIRSIHNLQYQLLVNFTERVANSKLSPEISNITNKCIQYISTKTNESITVSDVASHVDRSKSFISRTFKAQVGIDLSTFIMDKKLEESQGLLRFSDKSISDISNYLCFSSQSYFQNVFKKKFGLTPNQYRKKLQKCL